MAFSTDSRCGHAWQLADISPAVLAATLRCSEPEAKSVLAKTKPVFADRDRVRALLREIPAPSLAVLSLLAQHDGLLRKEELIALARDRFELDMAELAPAVGALLRQLLVVQLGVADEGTYHVFALVHPAADVVTDLLVDLDLPALPDAPFVAHPEHDGGRALLAACSALAHVDIKLTQSRQPHRAGVKRLAKQIGMDESALEELLHTGVECGLLVSDVDELLRPEPARLLAATAGRYPHDARLSALCEQLQRARGPLARERVERWLARCLAHISARSMYADYVAGLPGFCAGTVADVPAIGIATADGTAAASITPSFEVFLPPESRLADLVHVLAFAELVRIDRVVVARITKVSIGRAITRGASLDDMVARLARACRTPIPQNVEASIRDWAGSLAVATIATGRVVVVAASDEHRARTALDGFAPRLLAPGVLLVPESVSARAVAVALAKVGIHDRAPATMTSDATETIIDAASRAAARLPAMIGGDPALHARVVAYRRGDAAERKLAPRAAVAATDAYGDDDALVDEMLDVSPEAIEVLDRWERRTGCRIDDETFAVCATVFDVVGAQDRRFLLAAESTADLGRRVSSVLARGGFDAFIAKHRDRIRRLLPELETAFRQAVQDQDLEWHRDGIHARLEAAARTHGTIVLDLGSRMARVAITRVLARGKVWMVLGEDVDAEHDAIAVPLSSIIAVAELPVSSQPGWRPADGDKQPPGHIPCPCGSGRKYRQCCRRPTSAAQN